jgi:SecD/SecF fusion protein
VQQDATEESRNEKGQIDLNRKQKYLDSIYTEPVFNLFGLEYTFKEIKERELSLGLDLQGGMHVVLEVSPVEILKALAGANALDPGFKMALDKAKELQKNSQSNFTDLFYQAYYEVNKDRPLTDIFNNTITAEKGTIRTDDDVKKIINEEVGDAINRAEKIIRTRIDKFGVIQPNIQRLQGTGRIQLELPGVDNPQRVRNLLQGVAQLEFMPVYFGSEINPSLQKINEYLLTIEKTDTSLKTDTTAANNLLTPTDTTVKANGDTAKTDTATEAKVSSLIKLRKAQYGLFYSLKDTAKINRIFEMPKVKALLPPNTAMLWMKPKSDSKDGEEITTELVPVKTQKGKTLSGEVVINARVESDPSKGGMVQVAMTMNDAGAKKWKQMTREATQEKEGGYANRRIAIALDNVVYSAPEVQNEIPNGQSVITGNFNLEEATDLANILEAGKLPAPVRIVEEVVIGPSLGKEAIAQGIQSMLVGLLIVVVFMIFYYSKAGVIANVALLFNILFILGIMASFNSVLTLPGIAGIVLTIGMAVDANVLIFERIREEISMGRPMLQAINNGYDKAFSSIFDSNVTTIITGAILAWLGSGPVQGFAVTLIIGLLCSFFTAVFISKVIVLWLVKDKDPKSVTFSTVISRGLFKNLKFDIIGKRKIAYVLSGLLLLAGIISIVAQKGLNLGVDFKGGRSYIVQFEESIAAHDLRESLKDNFENTGTEVKAYGSNSKMKITTSYLVNDESSEADEKVEAALVTGLKEYRGDKFEIQSTTKVGATVADDIIWDSVKAIIFSLIGIFIYVYFRFKKWQFSLGGVIALFHDALIVIGMFSILRMLGIAYEIDQVFVAAILTIVGFSINDTVIVFDRVREFTTENPRMPLATVINNAINHTFSRTIITTFTVFIVVIILLLFGGETLRGFSLALLIGIFTGTYSTIFIAVPMVLDIRSKKEREAAALANKTASVK